MVTEIGEPISVSAVFQGGAMRPRAFLWRGRHYRVSQVLGHYQNTRGRFRQDHFNLVCAADEVYEVALDTEDMSWHLVRIYADA